jgi:hypothetical protein
MLVNLYASCCSTNYWGMTSNNDSEFSWGALGEPWWRENGAATRATEKQIIFACARHQGATQAVAAKWAGYSGSGDELRAAGSNAEGRTAVQDLLTLAQAAESGVDESIATAAEIDKKLTRLIRSPDGSISLKAVEAWERREKSRRERGEAPTDDGFSDWRLERDMLGLPNGGSAYLLLQCGQLANMKLLHDVHYTVMREPLGPELWGRFYAALNDSARKEVDKFLADSSWQADARRQIWSEVGRQPPGPIAAPVRVNGSGAADTA